jgi:deoxyribonuclease-4
MQRPISLKNPKKSTSKLPQDLQYGFHVRNWKRLPDDLLLLKEKHGCTVFQIFLTSPRQNIKRMAETKVAWFAQIKKFIADNNLQLFIHAPYTINVSRATDPRNWWNRALLMEMHWASLIGATGLVLHMGRSLDMDKNVAAANMATNIEWVVSNAPTDVQLLLETPAGQGSELGITVEELADIWNLIPSKIRANMGFCIDTCHLFAAGYDFRQPEIVQSWSATFEELIGLNKIKLIHLNDSQVECGTRRDRHAAPGKGMMKAALGELVRLFYELNIPMVIESPGGEDKDIAQAAKTTISWII